MISTNLCHALLENVESGLAPSWQVSRVIAPISPQEIEFLRSLTFADLIGPEIIVEKNNGLVQRFLMQILISVATQSTVAAFQSSSAGTSQLTESHEFRDVQAPRDSSPVNEPSVVPSSQSLSTAVATEDRSQTGQGRDPSGRAMERIAASGVKKLALKTGLHMAQTKLQELGRETAVNRAWQALGSGESPSQAKSIFLTTRDEGQRFAFKVSKTLSGALKTAVFANQAVEQGITPAIVEATKDALISAVAKNSAATMLKIVSCSNPAGLAAVIGSVISDVLKPTELAPNWHDLPPNRTQDLLQSMPPSQLPTLDQYGNRN